VNGDDSYEPGSCDGPGRITDDILDRILERRNAAHVTVLKSLAHLPRDQAMSIILSYIPIDRLEEVLPTIKGSDPPVEDPVEAFMVRLQIMLMRCGLGLEVHKTRNVPENAGKKPGLVFREALREVVT